MSGSADRRFCGLRFFHDRWGGPRTEPRRSALHQIGGTSQNVYENKGQVQKSLKSRSCGSQIKRSGRRCLGSKLFDFQLSTLNCLTRIRRNKRECL